MKQVRENKKLQKCKSALYDNKSLKKEQCQLSSSRQVSEDAHEQKQKNHCFVQLTSQVVLVVKNLPAKQETQETQVRSQGQEDPLKEGMATLSSILAWRIPRSQKPGRLQSTGLQKSWTKHKTEHAHTPRLKFSRLILYCEVNKLLFLIFTLINQDMMSLFVVFPLFPMVKLLGLSLPLCKGCQFLKF